jgi:N-acetylmuramic acid 6-phosphate etherase
MKLNQLDTEKVNQNSLHIDEMSTIDILKTINNEDQKVAFAVQDVILQIAQAVDCIYEKMCLGGRLIYVGAGTSGRLGILDASECPPTYGVEPTLIQGIIAGGIKAVTQAVEGAEDSKQLAQIDLEKINLNDKDVVCGIAASGRTPYVIAGLQYVRKIGCSTISLCCVQNGEISKYANYPIEVVVGPEVVTGSTRMKAGTAQKMVLNMISTSVMIKRGKVFGNLMVDVQPTNEKLKMRAVSIVCQSF